MGRSFWVIQAVLKAISSVLMRGCQRRLPPTEEKRGEDGAESLKMLAWKAGVMQPPAQEHRRPHRRPLAVERQETPSLEPPERRRHDSWGVSLSNRKGGIAVHQNGEQCGRSWPGLGGVHRAVYQPGSGRAGTRLPVWGSGKSRHQVQMRDSIEMWLASGPGGSTWQRPSGGGKVVRTTEGLVEATGSGLPGPEEGRAPGRRGH